MPASECGSVVPSLHAFFDFLTDEGLADQRGAATAVLHRELDDLAEEFAEAMGDPSQWGMAKTVGMAMLEGGVDPTDQDAVHRFMDEYNAGLPGPEPVAMKPIPPVVLAPEAELIETAEASETVRRIRTFVAWVGDGRPLTQKGRLKLADARELIELLGTDDVMDPVIGDKVWKTVSSEELRGLNLVVEWAKRVKVVRVVKNRLVPVKSAAKVLERPLDLWERTLGSFREMGTEICPGRYIESVVRLEFEEVADLLLSILFVTPVPVEAARQLAWEQASEPYDLSRHPHPQLVRQMADTDVDHAVEQLTLLGAVRTRPTAEALGTSSERIAEAVAQFGDDVTDSLEFTPLGVWAMHRRLRAEGMVIPTLDELAIGDVEPLIAAAMESGPEMVDAALVAWRDHHGVARAAAELAGLVRRTNDPAVRMCAYRGFRLLGEAGVAAVQELAGEDGTGAIARVWLEGNGHAPEGSAGATDAAYELVDRLTAMLRLAGHEGVVASFEECDVAPEPLLALLATSGHPALAELLQVLADAHPDKKVTKAARKALFTVRSRPTGTGRRTGVHAGGRRSAGRGRRR
jgi:hypothetical protein